MKKYDRHHITEIAGMLIKKIPKSDMPAFLTYVEDIPWSLIAAEIRAMRVRSGDNEHTN